ncbi:hypothetical protein DFH06DRAFT_1123828 [Mycena polygramma]|nr:hypothetical protein DFH06DRAFT_1123828 [Mycena polygramma]
MSQSSSYIPRRTIQYTIGGFQPVPIEVLRQKFPNHVWLILKHLHPLVYFAPGRLFDQTSLTTSSGDELQLTNRRQWIDRHIRLYEGYTLVVDRYERAIVFNFFKA